MPTLLLLLAFRGKGFRSTVFLFFSASWCISLRPICQNTTANRPLQDMSLVLLLAQVPVITKNHPPTVSLIFVLPFCILLLLGASASFRENALVLSSLDTHYPPLLHVLEIDALFHTAASAISSNR